VAEAAGRADRFPWPGFSVGLLLLVALHGPLLSLPAVFDEGPFLAGMAESRGAALAMRWLPIEVSLLGTSAAAHRLFALCLDVAVLALVARAGRGLPAPNLAVVAAAAFLVHPWRTESFVRLGARGVVLADLFAAVTAVALVGRHGAWRVVAPVAALLATAAQPGYAFVAFAAAAAAAPAHRVRLLTVAAAAGAGTGLWWLGAPRAATTGSAWCALDLLMRPWATGLEHLRADPWWAGFGAAVLLGAMVAAWRRRSAIAALLGVAALFACAASAGLRPPRTGLEYLGGGATPEAWLPFLLLLQAVLVALATGSRWRTLPLWCATALAVAGGFQQARRFDPPLQLIDHAVAVAPQNVELQVLRAQIELAHGSAGPRDVARSFAATALDRVGRALIERPGDPAARTLEVMALALLGRLDEARRRSDLLLAAFPDDWRSRVARAEVEAIAGDRLAALRWMRSAVAAQPSPELRAGATRLLDQLYGELRTRLADRQWSAARQLAKALAEVAPEEQPAHEAYVDTFSLAKEWPQALAAAETHFARFPRSSGAARRLAVIHQRLGHEAEAVRHDRLARELAAGGGAP